MSEQNKLDNMLINNKTALCKKHVLILKFLITEWYNHNLISITSIIEITQKRPGGPNTTAWY